MKVETKEKLKEAGWSVGINVVAGVILMCLGLLLSGGGGSNGGS